MHSSYTQIMGQCVAILGASNNKDRYAYRAHRALVAQGHRVIPVTPNWTEVDGQPTVPNLGRVTVAVNTLTVYVSAARSTELAGEIEALRPGRVIFNPGSENPSLGARLDAAGIPHENACTLVLLATNQF